MKKDHLHTKVWIIGASSGIGKALVLELAKRGAHLIVSARRSETLERLGHELGDRLCCLPLDVNDESAVQEAIAEVSRKHFRVDRVIFMAAHYHPATLEQWDSEQMRTIVDTNLTAAMVFSNHILPWLKQWGDAQLALCASVAGYTGLPLGQPYSATKAGLINFAESLHAEWGKEVDIKIINPGFVKTRMTDKNQFKMPMRISPEQAALAIAKGLTRAAFEIHFPKPFTLAAKTLQALPYAVRLRITRKLMPTKP